MWDLRPHRSDSTSKHNKLASHRRLKAARAARSRQSLRTKVSSHHLYRLRRVSLGSYQRVLRHRRSWGHSLRAFNHRWHRNRRDFSRLSCLNRLVSRLHWYLSRPASSLRWYLNRLASSRSSHRSLRALVVWGHHSGEVARHPCHPFLLCPHHSRTARLASYNPVSSLLHSILPLHYAEHFSCLQSPQGLTPVLDNRRSLTASPRNNHPRDRPRRTRTRRTCSLL